MNLTRACNGIALLLAIPVSKPEFLERVPHSDYLRKYIDPDANPEESARFLNTAWNDQYCPFVAEPIGQLLNTAEELGITVHRCAGLESLSRETTRSLVVVLVGHWKGPEVINDDFIGIATMDDFVERVRGEETPLARWLYKRFLRGERKDVKSKGKSIQGQIREILTEALRVDIGDSSGREDGVDEVLEDNVTLTARRRDGLNELFDGLLRPGNRLELYDSLHSKESVETEISKDFKGVLDLTTCTSTVLADFIAARRRFEFRTVQFPRVQEPAWVAISLMHTFKLVNSYECTYLEAREIARAMLEDAFCEIGKGTHSPCLMNRLLQKLKLWG